jgi:hypothetical protein
VEVDAIPLDVCGLVFGSPYMYTRDKIFTRRANQYHMIKDESLSSSIHTKVNQRSLYQVLTKIKS